MGHVGPMEPLRLSMIDCVLKLMVNFKPYCPLLTLQDVVDFWAVSQWDATAVKSAHHGNGLKVQELSREGISGIKTLVTLILCLSVLIMLRVNSILIVRLLIRLILNAIKNAKILSIIKRIKKKRLALTVWLEFNRWNKSW